MLLILHTYIFVYRQWARCASINPVRSIWPFVPSAPNLSLPYLRRKSPSLQIAWRAKNIRREHPSEFRGWNLLSRKRRVKIKMAQIGERIERSESLPGPTGRFDGFVPLMLLTAILSLSFSFPILSPFRPFAIVACKYERSFIRTESNSPNNVFLPPCPDVRSARRRVSSVRECTVIPFLRMVDYGKREAAGWRRRKGRSEKGRENESRKGGKSPDNQRLWRRAIVLHILRGAVKDACYERRTDKMTDRNNVLVQPTAAL